jgi:ABC-type polysaccharide/polyol phosphate export permease
VGVGIVFGFYATPIFYTLDLVRQVGETHPWLARLYYLNPMAELIEAYRQILFECRFPDVMLLAWPCVAALACLVAGVVVFRRNSALFSDHL